MPESKMPEYHCPIDTTLLKKKSPNLPKVHVCENKHYFDLEILENSDGEQVVALEQFSYFWETPKRNKRNA